MDKLIAIKITSDGKAFAVDQRENAAAVDLLQGRIRSLEAELDSLQKKLKESASQGFVAGQKENAAATDQLQARIRQLEGELDTLQKKLKDPGFAPPPALPKMGDEADKTARQLRQVAPQITDIVTQLSAGASPMQVFIQQGGQLKDVFGGVGPAAKAVGGYIASMITPTTLAVAAVGALAVAWYEGHEQSVQFTRQLILSGNAAGVSASQYVEMATSLKSIGATRGAALETLTAMADGGRVGADNLQRFSGIALQLNRLVGKPVQETVDEFKALGEQPVQATEKLTRSYNFVTAAVYQQIVALDQAGRHTEAAKVAQEAFADAWDERIPKMAQSLGTLERGWMKLTEFIKAAGAALLLIGAEPTLKEQIAQAQAQIRLGQMPADPRIGNQDAIRNLQANQQLLKVLQQKAAAEDASAKASAKQAESEQVAQRWAAQGVAVLSSHAKLQNEIDQAIRDGAALGKTREEIETRIVEIRKKYIDQDAQDAASIRVGSIRAQGEIEAAAVKANIDHITDLYRVGAISQAQYIDQVGAAEVKLMQDDEQRLTRQIAIAKTKQSSDKEVADLQDQREVLHQRIILRTQQIEEDQNTRRLELARKSVLAEVAEMQQWQDEQAAAEKAADDRYTAARQASDDYIRSLREEGDELDFQTSLLGKNAREQQRLTELRRIDLGLQKQLRDIDRRAAGGNLTADQVAAEQKRVREAAAEAAARVETKIYVQEWQRANDDIGESLYLALTGRGKDARDKLESLFDDLILRPTILAIMQPVTNSLTGALMGSGSTASAGGIGSSLGMLGSVGSLFGAGGLSGAIAGGAGWLTGATTLTGALSAGASLIGTGTAAGVASGLGMMAGALGPIGLGIAAIAAIASQFHGETRSGGFYTADANGSTSFVRGPSGGEIASDQVTAAISATVQQINAMLKAVGSQASVSNFLAGLESSGDSKGGVLAGGTLSTGQRFGENGSGSNYDGTFYERTSTQSPDAQAALQNFSQDLLQTTIQALQAATDVPASIKQALAGVNAESLSTDDATALIAKINTITQSVQSLDSVLATLPFPKLRAESFDAKEAMLEAAGGLDKFTSSLNDYYSNFFTQEEQHANVARSISEQLAQAGIDISAEAVLAAANAEDGRAKFRAFADSFGEGSPMWAALVSVSGAFASISTAAKTASDDVQGVADDLQTASDALKQMQSAAVSRVESLQAQGAGLRIQLLRLQGYDGRADVLQRQADTAGMSAAEIALYDYNHGLQQQIDAFDKVDTARQALLAGYDEESGRLDQMVMSFRGFATDLRDFSASLLLDDKLSPLTPTQQYNAARSQLESLYNTAMNGATPEERSTAYSKLQDAVSAFLNESRTMFAASDHYTTDFAWARALLANAATSADATADVAQLQLDGIKQQITLLGGIQDNTKSIAQLLADYQAAVTAALNSANGGSSSSGSTGSAAGGAPYIGTGGLVIQDGNIYGVGGASQVTSVPDAQAAVMALVMGGHNLDAYNLVRSWGATSADIDRLFQFAAGTTAGWAKAQGFPAFAAGGWHEGGWALVGEYGPELRFMPPSRVYDAGATRSMLSGDGGAAASELRQLRALLGQLLNAVMEGAVLNATATDRNATAIAKCLTELGTRSAYVDRLRRGAAIV
jgi:phage-related minor tail protein